jgi:integrase
MKIVDPIRDKADIEKFKNILQHKSYRDYFLFVFGINTGLRISDMLPLKVKDVKDKDYLVLKEKKSSKTKRFYLNSELKEEIKKYIRTMNDEDYLFPSRKGGYLSRVQAYSIIRDAGREVGLKSIGTHTLRKTFGYHFYKQYKDVAKLQQVFNHTSPSYTLRYIGIEQEEIDKDLEDFSL